jgi:hypothetical protein
MAGSLDARWHQFHHSARFVNDRSAHRRQGRQGREEVVAAQQQIS